jgi:hypothetical protein
VGTTFVGAISEIPADLAQNLQDEDFYAQIRPAAMAAIYDALPEQIELNNISINTSDLISTLQSLASSDGGVEIVPREWIQSQLARVISGAIGGRLRIQGQEDITSIALLQEPLLGEAGRALAQLIVSVARSCTEGEVQQLLAFLTRNTGQSPLIDFICNPPNLPDVDVRAAMEDIVVVILGEVAEQLATQITDVFADVNLQIAFETPAGVLSLNWPSIELATGRFNFSYDLPEDVQQSVEDSLAQIQAAIEAAVEQGRARVEQSRSDLQTLREDIITALTPTVTPTRVRPPTATATSTPIPTATPVPTATATVSPSTETDSSGDNQTRIGQAVDTALVNLSERLSNVASELNQVLIVVCGIVLLLFVIEILFLVRTWRGLAIWIGAALLIAGIVILLIQNNIANGQISVTPLIESTVEAVVQLRATFREAISTTVQNQLISPLLVQGLITTVLGAVLLIAIFFYDRRAAPPERTTVETTDQPDQPV